MLPKRKILILAANPKNSGRLRLDEEVREIEEGLARAQQRDQFELVQRWAPQHRDVSRAILEHEPHIVHFSGHGTGEDGIALEDEDGKVKLVSTEALVGLFKLFSDIECVVFNACYSDVQAKEISRHIPYVIGMCREIGDKAALAFSVGFYDALGAGKEIQFAYDFGCSAIQMAGIREHLTPVLIKKADAKSIHQTQTSSENSSSTQIRSTPQTNRLWFSPPNGDLSPQSSLLSSDVALVASSKKNPAKPLILLDPNIAKQWRCLPSNIHVYQGKSLAEIDVDRMKIYQTQWIKARLVTSVDLFLPEIAFIDWGEAIPSSLIPETSKSILFEGEPITPLLPISSLLLDYFTLEELVDRIEFRPMCRDGQQVEVSLNLPLSGTHKTNEPQNYRATRIYSLKRKNGFSCIPIIEIWPKFRAKNWNDYYAFFYDMLVADETFNIRFPESTDMERFQDSEGGNFSCVRLHKFPSLIECLDVNGQAVGLILLKPPPMVFPHETWTIGVDFGKSVTNAYINCDGRTEQLVLNEDLLYRVTDSPLETRLPVLLEYFMPESFLPRGEPLPLPSILTTQGSDRILEKRSRAVLDGRIYQPNIRSLSFQENWIETNLWSNLVARRLFLKNLILLISASATKQRVKTINWLFSYPSSYSCDDLSLYAKTCLELIQESSISTGVDNRCCVEPLSRNFIHRSTLVAQYFADKEGLKMSCSTCLDISDENSNISIWQDNALLHQCTLEFNTNHLLSNHLAANPEFINTLFQRDSREWEKIKGKGFYFLLNTLLRYRSDDWLKEERPYLTGEHEFDGLIRLMAIGFGGLYYYIGLLLRVLRSEGLYVREFPTPIYVSGSGCNLLHWLDMDGQFTQGSEEGLLLSRILSKASKLEDNESVTLLSSNPKDEVACGLVLNKTKLKGLDDIDECSLIPGEYYLINGVSHSFDKRMVVKEDVRSFDIPNLDSLNLFLYEFHKALKDLNVTGIQPIPGYKLSKVVSDNTKLWRGTKKSLDKILEENETQGKFIHAHVQPPFMLGLKALLRYLSLEWPIDARNFHES